MKDTLNTAVFIVLASLMVAFPKQALAVERIVVLSNGNVLRGDVQQTSRHFIVRTAKSQLNIPVKDVELVAHDLEGAYRAKAEKLVGRSSRKREELINWCLKVGHKEGASDQLKKLRSLAPDYSNLDILVRRVESFRTSAVDSPFTAKSPVPLDRQYALDRVDELSGDTLSHFTRRIQPLMSNRCGLAGCHGKSAGSTFVLRKSRNPSIRTTHTNLGATLQRIGSEAPMHTLLWMSANSAHGKLKRKPLSDADLELLALWIARVQRELGEHTKSSVRVASYTEPIDPDEDPFDPEAFNQASVGESSKEAVQPEPTDPN